MRGVRKNTSCPTSAGNTAKNMLYIIQDMYHLAEAKKSSIVLIGIFAH